MITESIKVLQNSGSGNRLAFFDSNGVLKALDGKTPVALEINVALQIGGPLLLPNGSAAAPALAFAVAPTVGLSSPGFDGVAFSLGGQRQIVMFPVGEIRLVSGGFVAWSDNATDAPSGARDTILLRDAANTLALRNGTNAQDFKIYNTINGGDFQRVRVGYVGTGGEFLIESQKGGTGNHSSLRFDAGDSNGSFSIGNQNGQWRVLSGFLESGEIADPAAPGTNQGRLYFKDNGVGKTQFVVRFPTGAVQVIATEP